MIRPVVAEIFLTGGVKKHPLSVFSVAENLLHIRLAGAFVFVHVRQETLISWNQYCPINY